MPPSLVALCIRILARYPDQIHALPVRLRLRPNSPSALLDELVPDPATLDPRLWAVITQLYAPLPKFYAKCSLPLYHSHLPLLQAIPPSNLYSLVTLLDLSATQHLTDRTIHALKFLHSLTALDASGNPLSAYAIRSLASTLQLDDDEDSPRRHRGPYELRILVLRNCRDINSSVYPELEKFPLLSVVDLRGTGCTCNVTTKFKPCPIDELYYPSSLPVALQALQSLQPDLSASTNPYVVSIDKLHPPETKSVKRGSVGTQDSYVVIPSKHEHRIKMGNTNTLQRQIEAREDIIRHENNKAAWYERQDKLEELEFNQSYNEELQPPKVERTSIRQSHASTRLPSAHLYSHGHNTSQLPPRPSSYAVAHFPVSSSSVSAGHPYQNHLRSSAPSRPHHSSVSAQRATPPHAYSSTSQHLKPHNNSAMDIPGNHLTALVEENRTLPNALVPAVRPIAGTVEGRTVAPAPSNATAFYARIAAPALPASTSRTSNALSDHRQSSSARASSDAPHLKLFRRPPAYAALSTELDRLEKVKKQRAAEFEDGNPRGGVTPLSKLAAIDMDSVKARKVKDAMDAAINGRVKTAPGLIKSVGFPPGFILDDNGAERQRPTSGTLMSTAPVFSFPDTPSASNLDPKSAATSKIRTMASASFEAGQPGKAPVTRSRNPFRKRVLSYPDMPEFAGGSTSNAPPSTKIKKVPSSDSIFINSNRNPTTPGNVTPKRVSITDTNTHDLVGKSGASMKKMFNSPDRSTKSKPLIPISAVKVPILPEEVRQEALRREAQELAGLSRKRINVEDGDEDSGDADAKQPPSKKRTIVKGRGSTSSIASTKGRAKTKSAEEKTKAFDWKGWGKKS